MGLDERLAALAEHLDEVHAGPRPDVDAALAATRSAAHRPRTRSRTRVLLAVAAVAVLVVGVAVAVRALGGTDGAPEQVHAGRPDATNVGAPPPIETSEPYLWLSASAVPVDGADVAVQLVDPTRSGDTWGVAASVQRWDGESWIDPVGAVLCTDFWDCVGEIGGSGAVRGIGLSAGGGRGPLTWLRVEGLDPGWYRLTQTSNEGTVAAASFEVRSDAPDQPPAPQRGNAHLALEPPVRLTAMSSDLFTVRLVVTGGMPMFDGWQDGLVRVERWEGGRWGLGFVGDDLRLAPATDPNTPDAYVVHVGPWPPGTYRLAMGTDDVADEPFVEGLFWVADEPGG